MRAVCKDTNKIISVPRSCVVFVVWYIKHIILY
jgi:hypothetical protein